MIVLTALLSLCLSNAEAKVHKRTSNFIDVEVPASNVLVFCEAQNNFDKTALLIVYALDEKTFYDFHDRRAWSEKECAEDVKRYHRLYKGAQSVRVVGVIPSKPEAVVETIFPKTGAPLRFKRKMSHIYATFVRIQAGGKCLSYFDGDCLPKNYWGGSDPALPEIKD